MARLEAARQPSHVGGLEAAGDATKGRVIYWIPDRQLGGRRTACGEEGEGGVSNRDACK